LNIFSGLAHDIQGQTESPPRVFSPRSI